MEYRESVFDRTTDDGVTFGNIFLGASSYQDWLVALTEGDEMEAREAYLSYEDYVDQIVRELINYWGDGPHLSELQARARGLIDGFHASFEKP